MDSSNVLSSVVWKLNELRHQYIKVLVCKYLEGLVFLPADCVTNNQTPFPPRNATQTGPAGKFICAIYHPHGGLIQEQDR